MFKHLRKNLDPAKALDSYHHKNRVRFEGQGCITPGVMTEQIGSAAVDSPTAFSAWSKKFKDLM